MCLDAQLSHEKLTVTSIFAACFRAMGRRTFLMLVQGGKLDGGWAAAQKRHMSDFPQLFSELLLGNAPRGFVGTIVALKPAASGAVAAEREQQLIEMGFIEGARVEILHEGAIARDPIAVRVDNITIALRRREAMAVVVR